MKLPELFYYASCTIPIVINSHILYMSKFNNFDSSYRTYISSVYVFAEVHPISSFISQVEHVTQIMFYLMLAMFQNDRVLFMYYWENNFKSITESHVYNCNSYKFIYMCVYKIYMNMHYRIVNHLTILLWLILFLVITLRYP